MSLPTLPPSSPQLWTPRSGLCDRSGKELPEPQFVEEAVDAHLEGAIDVQLDMEIVLTDAAVDTSSSAATLR